MDYIKGTRVPIDQWRIGETYFLPNGKTSFTLLNFKRNPHEYTCTCLLEYPSIGIVTNTKVRTLHKAETKETDTKENNMNTLYEFSLNGKQVFGTKIAVNYSGLWVMEIKGSGEVVAVDKDSAEEVIPYSIGVKFMTGDKVYDYLAPKGKYDLGFYLLDSSFVQVVELDTKSKMATKEFKPTLKFVTEKID